MANDGITSGSNPGIRRRHRRTVAMAKGTVKWFNDTKGFGFIEQEGGGEDVFVHHSAIEMDGYRSLKEGQVVEFELAQADKGLRAANVKHSN
jgi:CspA family cold shock protein